MKCFLLLCVFAVFFAPSPSSADWLIYHKPAFEGQILDGDTKEPIEGAVVVVQYSKQTIGLGAGTLSSIINIREVLTDKAGRFRIPSYTTLIQPFSWEERAFFIIYKPGYIAIDYLYDRGLEELFSGKMVGIQDKEIEWLHNPLRLFRYRSPNIIEIPKAKTREERLRAIPGLDPDVSKKSIILKKIIVQEDKNNGL